MVGKFRVLCFLRILLLFHLLPPQNDTGVMRPLVVMAMARVKAEMVVKVVVVVWFWQLCFLLFIFLFYLLSLLHCYFPC